MIIRTRTALRRIGLALGQLLGCLRRPRRGVVFRIVSCDDSGGPPESMPKPKETCAVVNRLGDLVTWPACGHEGRQHFGLDLYGTEVELTDAALAKHGLCGDCLLKKMLAERVFVRCARCGHAILPKMPVAIVRDGGDFRQEWKTRVEGGLVCCLDMRCCETGGVWVGYWGPGRVISIDEACSSTRVTTPVGTPVNVIEPK